MGIFRHLSTWNQQITIIIYFNPFNWPSQGKLLFESNMPSSDSPSQLKSSQKHKEERSGWQTIAYILIWCSFQLCCYLNRSESSWELRKCRSPILEVRSCIPNFLVHIPQSILYVHNIVELWTKITYAHFW